MLLESNSSYINQYLIFKRKDHIIYDTFIPVLETTNYYAKPLLLAQAMNIQIEVQTIII